MNDVLVAADRFPWSRDALEILVTNWEKEPSLFDKTDKSYSSSEEREVAYANIQTEIQKVYPGCQLNVDQVRSKIISLRCQYNRERRRLHKKNGQSNGVTLMKSPWWFRRLNFLSNYIVTRRSKYECSLAKNKGYLNYFNDGRIPLTRAMLHNPLPHIPSNNSSFETDDSRVSSVFAEPSNAAHLIIKQEKQSYAEHSDRDEDRLSYSGAEDDDHLQSESSASGHQPNNSGSAENDTRLFQDSVLHSTSNILYSIRQFMEQTAVKTTPTTTADSLQSFGHFLVSSLAEIKDDQIVTEAQEACARAIFAAKNAWHRQRNMK